MKQRVRYKRVDDKLISGDVVSKSGAVYIVYIDLENKRYMIRNKLSLRKYEGGEGVNNMNVLKRNIKKHLAALGCEFEPESRSRTFGLCPKNYSQALHLQKSKKENEI